jgi:glutamine amidotransferase
MGWNELTNLNGPLFLGMEEGCDVYFVHSYYAEVSENTSATSDYDQLFSAALSKNNFFATQFHPEKSGSVGEKILQNFLAL